MEKISKHRRAERQCQPSVNANKRTLFIFIRKVKPIVCINSTVTYLYMTFNN